MDIRNWLKPKPKTATETKRRKIEDDDDDDVIPNSPDVQIVNKKKKLSTQSSKGKQKSEKDKLKEVKASDLFGCAPIKRTEPIVKKEIKKTETGIHSDEEFEKSLLEIDNVEQMETSNESKEKNKHTKTSHHSTQDPESLQKAKTNGNHDTKHIKSPAKPLKEKSSKDVSKKVQEIKKEVRDSSKRKFTEFIEEEESQKSKKSKIESDSSMSKANDDADKSYNHDVTMDDSVIDEDAKSKKKKANKSLNESALTDEERYERKIQSARLYQSYLNRSGPKHLGAKEMPEGAPNCLKDCAFLLTGVLDSFEREEIVETIAKYGGCVKSGISKKVTHVLAGEDAGPAKMAKAEDLGIPIINEDDFLKMIKDSNKKTSNNDSSKEIKKKEDHNRKSSKDNVSKDKDHAKSSSSHKIDKSDKKKDKTDSKEEKSEIKKENKGHKEQKSDSKQEYSKLKTETELKRELKKEKIEKPLKVEAETNSKEKSHKKLDKPKSPVKEEVTKLTNGLKSENFSSTTSSTSSFSSNSTDTKIAIGSTMWVEKHKPQNVKQIIGQTGEGSNVNKLINWLTKWYVNRKAKLAKPSPWAKNDDGGYFKAALLSGPPGVGKTTTVALVCKQLGFDMVEFNASDTRNKTLIKEQIGELLTTNSLSGYAKGATGKQAVSKKHVLVMDEVDGMAGNEDRGGLQELIGLIKTTSVPIICMCNDRNSQKMRSLVNYCYDLRFNRPRVDQIKAAMRSICCRENIKISPDVLGQLIVSANQDVRQTLNLLSMWAIDPTRMDAERLSKDASVAKKDVKLGPWEAIRKVFSAEDHKTMSINAKSDLFFYDYSLAPLFVQENYLQVQPHCPKNEVLQRISQAADCIAFGDVIDKRIRSGQAWSLLPMQAMYSSVLPGHYLSGHVAGQIQFPGWLGKNSRANKMHRLCQEIHAHTRLSTTGSKSSIFLDYASHLRDAIVNPLIKEKTDGIEQSLRVLESYNLLRDDLDSLVELSVWPGQRNPTVLIDSKVKAAMTRTYNKKASALPYAPGAVKRARAADDDDGLMDEDSTQADEAQEDSDPEHDMLIKKKKTQQAESSSSNNKPGSSKGKGKGSGKGKKK